MPHALGNVDIVLLKSSFLPNEAGRTARRFTEKRHDGHDPAARQAFFGEVSGVDLRKPLTPQEAADVEAGMDNTPCCCFATRTLPTSSRWRSR